MAWQSPTVTVKWGSYFGRDAEEEKATVEMTVAALTGKTITRRTAVEKLAPIFSIENIDAALDELEKEHEADAKRELDATTAALDAEARAQRTVVAAKAGVAGAGGNSGRPPSG